MAEALTLEQYHAIAARKGYRVTEGKTGWLVHVPAKSRRPANTQGDFKSERSAWLAAASLALDDEA
jgi:hypothetical protein